VEEIKPKLTLDSEMLKRINKFYSCALGDEVLGTECFSDPKLDSHYCNPQAPVEGGKSCEHCGNILGRQCKITCHINYFCLGMYAFRLGIGASKKNSIPKAIQHNLGSLTYKKLYQLVMERCTIPSKKEKTLQDPVIHDGMQLEIEVEPEPNGSDQPEKKPKRRLGPLYDDTGRELLSITEASRLYGCTYVNMYSHVKRGNLQRIVIDGCNYVLREEVEKLRESRKTVVES